MAFHQLPVQAESEIKNFGGLIGVGSGRRTFHVLDDDDFFNPHADLHSILEIYKNSRQLPDTKPNKYLLVYLAPSAMVFLAPRLKLSLFKPDITEIAQLPEAFVKELRRAGFGQYFEKNPELFLKELTFLPDRYRIATYPHYSPDYSSIA